MCTVNSVILFKKDRSPEELGIIKKIFENLMILGVARGKDATGITIVKKNGDIKNIIKENRPATQVISKIYLKNWLESDTTVILGHNRAEPITEGKSNSEANIHPIVAGNTIGIHNGIISNDAELAQKYGIKLVTGIDTELGLAMLDQVEWTKNNIKRIVQQWVGGYSLVCCKLTDPTHVAIIKNFKPLAYCWVEKYKAMFISSEKEFLDKIFVTEKRDLDRFEFTPQKFEGDVCMIFDTETGTIQRIPLQLRQKTNKALVVASGGMDSTCAAAILKYEQGLETDLIHFNYKHKAKTKELEAVHKIADILQCKVYVVDLDWLGNLPGQVLTDPNLKVPEGRVPMETVSNWVWARNLVLTGIAISYADGLGYSVIGTGVNLEEGCILDEECNKIRMFDKSFKMPSSIQVGDELLSWNETNKKIEKTIVTEVFTPKFDKYLKIYCEGRQSKKRKHETIYFTVSVQHPFYVKGEGWVKAKDLRNGDILTEKDLNEQSAEAIKDFIKGLSNGLKIVKIETINKEVQTYNYHCSPNNNFFIGESGVLVHNSPYPDNTVEFSIRMSEAAEMGIQPTHHVEVVCPVGRFMKKEIVKKLLDLKPELLDVTWSCDLSLEYPCGTCGSCCARKNAFKMLGMNDPRTYVNTDFKIDGRKEL